MARRGGRPRVWLHCGCLGCLGCSIPLLMCAAVVVLVVLLA